MQDLDAVSGVVRLPLLIEVNHTVVLSDEHETAGISRDGHRFGARHPFGNGTALNLITVGVRRPRCKKARAK